ncbi:MAG: pantoate--beta-alanine ligase [Legionellales bacterium]|nr:pantoate--beta-alanine ligase [Legionellales bacterium]
MKIVKKIVHLESLLSDVRSVKKKISLVPTMGNLHKGHLSLVEKAKKISDYVVVTIFVNPTQFVEGEDFANYPRTLDSDINLLSELDVDLLFVPEVIELYPTNDNTPIIEISNPELESIHCGKYRPGHFKGVATIVSKLFSIVQPNIALFGEKDYQQLLIIRSLVKNLLLPIEVVSAPTIREDSGLAMSSRNTYLSKSEFRQAPKLYKCIKETIKMIRNGDKDYEQLEKEANIFLEQAGFKVEYYSICDSKTLAPAGDDDAIVLVAAWLGKTRLIDNARVHTYD